MSTLESHCARCLKPAPSDDDDRESVYWHVVFTDDTGQMDEVVVICPDCIARDQQQAMDDMHTDAEAHVDRVLEEVEEQWPDGR